MARQRTKVSEMQEKYLWPGAIMFVAGMIIAGWSYGVSQQYQGILGQIGLAITTLFDNGNTAYVYYIAQQGLLIMGIGAVCGILGATIKDETEQGAITE